MLIVMNASAGKSEIDNVVRVVESLGFRAHVMPGANRTAIGITGNQGAVDLSHFENLPGVSEAIRVTKPYKLITLDLRPDRTIVDLGDGARIGDGSLAIIAGPCAVEKYADMMQIGARNMQNFTLLRRVGRSKLPVLLKRGMAATLEEWLLAAEYVMAEGNYNIVLCERGVR